MLRSEQVGCRASRCLTGAGSHASLRPHCRGHRRGLRRAGALRGRAESHQLHRREPEPLRARRDARHLLLEHRAAGDGQRHGVRDARGAARDAALPSTRRALQLHRGPCGRRGLLFRQSVHRLRLRQRLRRAGAPCAAGLPGESGGGDGHAARRPHHRDQRPERGGAGREWHAGDGARALHGGLHHQLPLRTDGRDGGRCQHDQACRHHSDRVAAEHLRGRRPEDRLPVLPQFRHALPSGARRCVQRLA